MAPIPRTDHVTTKSQTDILNCIQILNGVEQYYDAVMPRVDEDFRPYYCLRCTTLKNVGNGGCQWMGKLKRRFWYYRLIGEWSRSGHRQNPWCLSSSTTSVNFFANKLLRLISAVLPEAFWRLEQCTWWDLKRLDNLW